MTRPMTLLGALLALGLGTAHADEITVPVNFVDASGSGTAAGQIRIVETTYGVVFYPMLKGLPPGLHGFHVHEKASCAPAGQNGATVPAGGAGGHLDPALTKTHGEPWGAGHLGDLPPLFVAADGSAVQPVLGPRLKLADVRGHAIMVHAGGDNHADQPAPLGGGGGRIACGVIGA